jgi:hypothetical protein
MDYLRKKDGNNSGELRKREKKMLRMVNQSRIKATRNAPRYKFGYRIPCNYSEAMQFDLLKNGNTLW